MGYWILGLEYYRVGEVIALGYQASATTQITEFVQRSDV
jgi:hypothetical protein